MVSPRARVAATVIALAAIATLAKPPNAHGASRSQSASVPTTSGALRIEMRNVFLHVNEHAGLHVRTLRGEAVSATPGSIAVLDDPRSFSIDVSGGTVALGGNDLAALLNDIVFAYKGAPLTGLSVRTTESGIVLGGVLHKGVALRFTMTARLTLEPDGRIRAHPTQLRLLGEDGEKLLHALGLHLSNMLDLRGARGAAVDRDDLLLDALAIIPPPKVSGRLAAVRAERDFIVLDFARTAADTAFGTAVRPDADARNFVYFRGGRLRFGRLEMSDTDLLIRDADERDAFDLYLERYARQLSAGYSRTLPDAGLRVIMPDYRALGGGAIAAPRVPADSDGRRP